MDVERAIQNFLFHCKYEKNLAGKTLAAYRIDLQQFHQFVSGECQICEVDAIDKHILRTYLKHLSNQTQPKTVKRKFATLSSLFRFLEMEDDIVVSPFRKMQIRIHLDKHLPLVLTLGETQRLWRYLYTELKELSKLGERQTFLLLRDVAIFEMLFATGMRVAELAGLQRRDVDLEVGSVRIFGKGRKERLIPLCEAEVLASLRRYLRVLNTENGPFFLTCQGRRVTEDTVRAVVKKYTAKAGLEKKVTPHTLRHTVATLLLENGVNMRYIQQMLGHSNITTTELYARVNTIPQRKVLSTNHPRKKLITPSCR